jgi:fructokinase
MNSNNAVVFGEALIDLIETENGQFDGVIGGSPFNVALAMTRAGINVQYAAPTSIDANGKRITQFATKEGIHVPFAEHSQMNTSLALVTKDSLGQARYRLYRSHIADLDIDASRLISTISDDVRLFHTGSLALVPPMETMLLQVFEYLQGKGIEISIDINMRDIYEYSTDEYKRCVERLMKNANVLKVSDEDLMALGILDNHIEYCQQLIDSTCVRLVAYTRGHKGAMLITNQQIVSANAISVEQVADTVGAGDTFFANLLSYLLHYNQSSSDLSKTMLEQALNFSNLAAALNVMRHGCNPPKRVEVNEYAKHLHIDI